MLLYFLAIFISSVTFGSGYNENRLLAFKRSASHTYGCGYGSRYGKQEKPQELGSSNTGDGGSAKQAGQEGSFGFENPNNEQNGRPESMGNSGYQGYYRMTGQPQEGFQNGHNQWNNMGAGNNGQASANQENGWNDQNEALGSGWNAGYGEQGATGGVGGTVPKESLAGSVNNKEQPNHGGQWGYGGEQYGGWGGENSGSERGASGGIGGYGFGGYDGKGSA